MFTQRILGGMCVGLCLIVLGCGPKGGEDQNGNDHGGDDATSESDDHVHPDEGPHGGHLIELGDEEYHAELLHDDATHTVTVYILDGTGKEEVGIDQTSIALQVYQDGEYVTHTLAAVGGEAKSSEFSLADENLCDLLLDSEELKGRLNVTIDGQDYVGTIDHHGHDHADH